MNWIIKEAQNADSRKDRIILENPESREELDNLLMEKFYPAIIQALKETDLPYNPINEEDIHIDSVWDGPRLGRNLLFFLYDHAHYPVLRGDITVSKTGYMFKRTFSPGLPRETEPDFLHVPVPVGLMLFLYQTHQGAVSQALYTIISNAACPANAG